MCTFKSGIILKDRVFVPDYESHTDMLNELGIKDTQKNAERLFVRAELIPPGHDPFTDIDTWQLKVDQDIIPDWFVKEYEEKRMRAAVMEYAKGHIHIGVKGLVLDRGNHYIKDCEDVTAMGSSTVTAMDSSTVTAMDSSTVTAWGSSTVTAMDSSTVTAWGSSTVTAMDSSTVTAWGSSTVTAWGSSTVTAMGSSTVTARDSSTVTARDSSTVTAWGSSTVTAMDSSTVTARDSSTVTAWDSSTVTARDSSTVTAMDSSTVTAWGSSTVTAWGSSTVTAPLWSSVPCENIVLANNSTFKDCRIQKIFQCGDWEIVSVMPNSDEPAPLPKMS